MLFTDGFRGNPEFYEEHVRLEGILTYNGFTGHSLRIAGGYTKQEESAKERKNYGPSVLDLANRDCSGFICVVDGTLTDVSNTPYAFIEDQDRDVWYASIQDQWQLANDWNLTMGLRYDDYSDFGSTVNPRAALVWDASTDLTAKLMYGRSFRAPSFAEQFLINNPVDRGNPDLDPETAQTYELAFDYRASFDWRVGFNVFYYEIEDLIDFAPTPQGTQVAQNVGRQQGQGFEFETEWNPAENLRIVANYAWQNAEDEEFDEDAARAPEQQAYLRAHWKPRAQLVADRRAQVDRRPQSRAPRPARANRRLRDCQPEPGTAETVRSPRPRPACAQPVRRERQRALALRGSTLGLADARRFPARGTQRAPDGARALLNPGGSSHFMEESRNTPFARRIRTRIWQELADPRNPWVATDARCHGYAHSEMIGRLDYAQTLFLLLRGELPGEHQHELLRRFLVAFCNPGPRHGATRAVMNAAASGTRSQHLGAIGLALLGGEHLGSAEVEQAAALPLAPTRRGSGSAGDITGRGRAATGDTPRIAGLHPDSAPCSADIDAHAGALAALLVRPRRELAVAVLGRAIRGRPARGRLRLARARGRGRRGLDLGFAPAPPRAVPDRVAARPAGARSRNGRPGTAGHALRAGRGLRVPDPRDAATQRGPST